MNFLAGSSSLKSQIKKHYWEISTKKPNRNEIGCLDEYHLTESVKKIATIFNLTDSVRAKRL